MVIIKKLISSKFLEKSNQFKFYKDNYFQIKKEKKLLNEKLNNVVQENVDLRKKINNYLDIFEEIKKYYILYNKNFSNINSDYKIKILFVLHSGSGGTPKTVFDLVNNIYKQYDCYLLTSDKYKMNLYCFDCNEFKIIETVNLVSEWKIEKFFIDEYYDIYLKFLIKYNFDIVHIHHLIFHTFDLPKLCNELQIHVILSIHDLYYICPAYTLLDGEYIYCEGKCSNSNSNKNCYIPMENMTGIDCMKNFVNKWRQCVNKMFSYIDVFIVPSNFIKNIVNEFYSLSDSQFKLIEHGIDYDSSKKQLFEVPDKNTPTKILFLGNLYLQKGYPLIKELYEIDEDKNLEFHFLGFTPKELSGIGVNHGIYQYDELYDKIKKIKPSFIGIFTLTGESYCYTLSEAWSFGIPVLVSELGALKERISDNGGGWFIDIADMHNSYEKILSIIKNPNEYKSKQQEIKDILLTSTETMSEEYMGVYLNLIK